MSWEAEVITAGVRIPEVFTVPAEVPTASEEAVAAFTVPEAADTTVRAAVMAAIAAALQAETACSS